MHQLVVIDYKIVCVLWKRYIATQSNALQRVLITKMLDLNQFFVIANCSLVELKVFCCLNSVAKYVCNLHPCTIQKPNTRKTKKNIFESDLIETCIKTYMYVKDSQKFTRTHYGAGRCSMRCNAVAHRKRATNFMF